jgi:uncharacterized protein YggE
VFGTKAKPVIALGLMILLLCACSSAQDKGTLRVTGVGTVTVPTDTVYMTVSTKSTFENASMNTSSSDDKLNLTVEALKAAGVKDREILPGRYKGVSTYYTRICDRVNNTTICRDNKVYLMSEKLRLRLNDSDQARIDGILQAAEDAGAVAEVSGYALSDTSESFKEAKKMAIDNAKENAMDYASAVGMKIGNVVAINELGYPDVEIGSDWTGPDWTPGRLFGSHNPMMWRGSPWSMNRFFAWREIPAGMADVTAYVDVTYEVA